VLVTWAFEVVPSGLSLRGPETTLDVSDKTADSDGCESMAVVVSGPLG